MLKPYYARTFAKIDNILAQKHIISEARSIKFMPRERIKIGFIGNQNNNHFALVRYLRRMSYDAELLLTDTEQDHFHPRCDTFSVSYMDFTRQLDWGGLRSFFKKSTTDIRKDLEDYDILIGTGLAPAYLERAGRKLDIIIPYGDDVWGQTFYKIVAPQYLHKQLISAYYQRRGLGFSAVVHFGKQNELLERQICKYASRSVRWMDPMPMVYAPEYESDALETMASKTHWGHIFQRIRESTDLMIVSPARHVWYNASDPNSKGTEILIEGYRHFCKRNVDVKSQLILFEYGKDIDKSRRMVDRAGLKHRVSWLPKMYRKDLMIGLRYADIACGQFGLSWMQNGVLFEALVASKPLLTWRDDAQFREYANLYPIYNANTSELIAKRLEEYVANPEAGRETGRLGRLWYEKEVVKSALAKYCAYIETRAAVLGKKTH